MDWLQNLPLDDIEDISKKIDVDSKVLSSIVMVESGGDPLAIRYEAAYRYTLRDNFLRVLADQFNITIQTLDVLQKCSFGLCQIMGALALDDYHLRESPVVLLDPKKSLYYGALHLKAKMIKYPREAEYIASYNSGSPIYNPGGTLVNESYVDRVYSFLRDLRS